jgi:hypothetical protein
MGFKGVSGTSTSAPGPIGASSPSTGRFTGFQAATVTKTAAYTATSSDFTILCDATTAAFSVTLPAAAAHPGRIYNVKKIDVSANAVTIQANGAELIDGSNTKVIGSQYQSAQIQSNGTFWSVI